MPDRPIGSIWTVRGVADSLALVLVGPFCATRSRPEYVIAPLYWGREPGFRQTDEDVELRPEETGLGSTVFAAIWNVRPALSDDLEEPRGHLPDEGIAETRDIYWASINETPTRSDRLGRRVRSGRDPVIAFQRAELDRWETVSGRVLQLEEEPQALPTAGESPGTQITLLGVGMSGVECSADQLRAILQADPSTIADAMPGIDHGGRVAVNSVPHTLPDDEPGRKVRSTAAAHAYIRARFEEGGIATADPAAANADFALAA